MYASDLAAQKVLEQLDVVKSHDTVRRVMVQALGIGRE